MTEDKDKNKKNDSDQLDEVAKEIEENDGKTEEVKEENSDKAETENVGIEVEAEEKAEKTEKETSEDNGSKADDKEDGDDKTSEGDSSETDGKTKKTSKTNKDSLIVINDDVHEDAKWYVVHTYSGHERKVAELINEMVLGRSFQNRVFKILIPTQEKIIVSDGKKRKIDEKLFPGYIIVNMVMDDDAWYLVRSTKGVTGFVGTGNNPTPLPQTEVDALMKFMTMEAPKFEAKFREGDSVKITDGPFQDFLGKVDEVNDDQGKVRVLVSVFGRETPVELDFTQISSI